MLVETGSTPTLTLEDSTGAPLNLADLEQPVFLYFMRALSCAQCNAHVQNMVKNAADFDAAGVKVVVAVPTTTAEAAAWREKKHVPFPVVVGTEGSAHEEVGLMRKVFGAIQQSGGVLFDRDGVVRYAHAATNPTASYNRGEVAAAIAGLPVA
jgi:peroxiredoxin